MEFSTYSIDVVANMRLNKRELELLNHMTAFSQNEEMAKFLAGMQTTGSYAQPQPGELKQFIDHIHTATGRYMTQVESENHKIFRR